jgi:activator of HSP90 ATPase
MTNFYTGFFNDGIVTILLLLIIFSSIALLASWIRKILLPESKDILKVDPKKAVKEELERVLVPLENPLTPKTKTIKIEPVVEIKSSTSTTKKSSTVTTKKLSTKNATKRRSKVS